MILSLLIVAFIAVHALRGWRRGLVVEVIELLGLVLALAAAFVTWPALRGVLNGYAAAFGGLVVFGLVFAGASYTARRAGRETSRLPSGGRVVDGAGGSVLSSLIGLTIASALLILAITAPGARIRTAGVVCEAPVARLLISAANPLHRGAERLALLGRPALLWLSQQMSDGFTLSHVDSLCADLPAGPAGQPQTASGRAFTFPAVGEHEIETAPTAEEEILRRLNEARATEGLEPLAADAPLGDVGRAHSRDMYLRGYFAHETPECSTAPESEACTDPFDRIQRAGIRYEVAGENLALAPTSESAHRGLMESPGHRANILSPDFTRVGIGVYEGPYGLMVSQEFAG